MKPTAVFKNVVFGVLFALLLTGCANQSHVRPGSPMTLQPNTGWVVVSLTHSSPAIGIFSAKFSFSPFGASRPSYGIDYFSRDMRGNPQTLRISIEDGDLLGEVALIELPAGKYVADKWVIGLSQFVDFFGNVELTSDKYSPMNFLFTVEPGKIIYIGNIHISVNSRTSITHTFRDMRTRDLSLLVKKHTNLGAAEIENRLITRGN